MQRLERNRGHAAAHSLCLGQQRNGNGARSAPIEGQLTWSSGCKSPRPAGSSSMREERRRCRRGHGTKCSLLSLLGLLSPGFPACYSALHGSQVDMDGVAIRVVPVRQAKARNDRMRTNRKKKLWADRPGDCIVCPCPCVSIHPGRDVQLAVRAGSRCAAPG